MKHAHTNCTQNKTFVCIIILLERHAFRVCFSLYSYNAYLFFVDLNFIKVTALSTFVVQGSIFMYTSDILTEE